MTKNKQDVKEIVRYEFWETLIRIAVRKCRPKTSSGGAAVMGEQLQEVILDAYLDG